MLIQGICNTTKYVSNKYIELLNNGVEANQILVLVQNPYKKNLLINEIKKQITSFQTSKNKIYTFSGLCYNAFKDNWEFIKSLSNSLSIEDEPNLCGLEVSQYIFKQSIKEADFSDYISKVNLLHQLFRRYSLIVQNNLSIEEVTKRSKLLNETFYKDAQTAIDDYKLKTIQYKSFDYLRQMATLPLIYQKTDYFKDIKYLLIEDADEYSFAFWQFIDAIMLHIEDYLICYDKNGSTRCGYLCAYKNGVEDFKKKYSPKETQLIENAEFYKTAECLFQNIKENKKTKLNSIQHKNDIRRLDMIDRVLSDINKLIENGTKPSEISIISPLIDDVLIEAINSNSTKTNYQIISGSEKLSDIKTIKHLISILKLINNIELREYEIKSIFIEFLNIPFKKCFSLINEYQKNKKLITYNFNSPQQDEKYTKFLSVIKAIKAGNYSLVEQIRDVYSNIITDKDSEKYEFLLKEAQSFECAFKERSENLISEFITQIENSVISENPINSFSIKNNSILVSTPQKIIDYSLKTKYQFWLDISNSEWFKQDTGTLYNAWVLNRDWNGTKLSFEDEISLARDKGARIIRKLMLNAQKEIHLYSSIYDNTGNENFGGLTDYLISKEEQKKEFKIIPREDQKPVLEYKKDKMGVMAVPGAGKTTILLALIMNLLEQQVKPENIFVLTYMESAAKNFKERIKIGIAEDSELPNISTIHGLALRIIKENGNYTKVGLDENFEICDDTTKERILKELFYKLKIDEEKYENYLKSISTVKLSEKDVSTLKSKHNEIQEFYNFLNEYNKTLKSQNMIDYDDMLKFAVELLKNNKEVAQYYQNLCQYIIEDEAQDSSELQQTMINILAMKHKNVVRCGDINQSITATFTNSNLDGFKNFIKQNKKVEMTSSQRCAKPIYTLANKMIKQSLLDNDKKEAFYPIEIIGTDKNPKSDTEPTFLTFEHEKEEKEFILNKIKELKETEKTASIAILTRLNSQVNEYNEFFNSNGIKTNVRTDCLSQKIIYKYIIGILNIINAPFNNKQIIEFAKFYLHDNNINDETIFSFLEELKEPFINTSIDEITNEFLLQLYWDIDYWLNKTSKPIEDTITEIGQYYSKNSVDKSNTYLISTLVKRLKSNNETIDDTIKKLEYNAQKPLSAYKFFEDEIKQDENSINIMTMHKSKGDEFDYVFIPQLNENNYPLEKKNIKLKSGGHFVQTIKNTVLNCGIKTPEELKKEQIEETLRLLYVGITRAKKELILTNAKQYLKRKNTTSSPFFEELLENIS